MEVTLLVFDDTGNQCTKLGLIDECSTRSVWCGFRVPHSFFVVVNVTKVNTKYNGQTAYYEEETITILNTVINHRVLWSGYKVRPTELLCPSRDTIVKDEGIINPPIQIQLEKRDNNFFSSDINTIDSEDELEGQVLEPKRMWTREI